jgi:hypothetical protein
VKNLGTRKNIELLVTASISSYSECVHAPAVSAYCSETAPVVKTGSITCLSIIFKKIFEKSLKNKEH